MSSWKEHGKLFIPGPVEVFPEVLQELARPQVGHRSQQFKELYADTNRKLQQILNTKGRVWLATSSATGVWEAAARNCVAKKAVSFGNGAFSEKWGKCIQKNGKQCDIVTVDWGKAIKPELVDKTLASGDYDAMTFAHNETSTGVMSPLEEISEVMQKYPDVLFMVDAVSSMTATKIDVDRLGIDICLASVQKAFSLPPGLALFTVSDKAFEKHKIMENRGHYFDFAQFEARHLKNNTITTPPIPQIYALNLQCDRMLAEGLENRYARHVKMAEYVRGWALDNGFGLFAESGYESVTLTCLDNREKNIDVPALIKALYEKHRITLGNGYGDLKNKTFRIAHMGDMQMSDLEDLLGKIEAEI